MLAGRCSPQFLTYARFLSLQVVEVLKRAAIDCGCYMVYGQSESYTDLGNAQLLALDAVSAEEARWNKVTFVCCVLWPCLASTHEHLHDILVILYMRSQKPTFLAKENIP